MRLDSMFNVDKSDASKALGTLIESSEVVHDC
jgi:hypothetical protein